MSAPSRSPLVRRTYYHHQRQGTSFPRRDRAHVSEAEKYKAEDDANRNRIESKNGLENYCYSLKGSISGDEVGSKMDPADKSTLEGKIGETISWLDSNPAAEKEEY